MKTTQLLLGLLLLSISTFGQTIIPQKADTIDQKPKLQYFGDEGIEKDSVDIKEESELVRSVKPDTVTTQPVIIKYYQATEPYQPVEEEKPKRNKHQIKTLTGKMNHSGGYGAISFKTSEFKDETLVMGGVRGAWIVNRTLAIGIDAYGIIPTTKYQDIDPNDMTKKLRLLGGYGGLMLEPILFSNEVVHLTFPVSAGAGWLGYEDPDHEDFLNDSDGIIDEDVFWYVEPGANLEINIAHNFRLDLGVSKRFTQDLQLVNTATDEFDEISYYLTLKIGGF
ncbi:hypothetical protein SAMN04488029_1029 [Reichenbachiella faecimaris]|uniref:Outer membrane protein beta-barrel domain-containing protein n=1 Tax=Reichenbachiella faecimaris TaxID=692418 RepID=A0A1W2G7L5_REIFA|nr:hypothetical protein [Reichenbachiella faecimaris]SMD32679.1 hypothetical protein SAMN04488029_1029 [Reichenbachiella faecimaris]